jgi:hypothetical protein
LSKKASACKWDGMTADVYPFDPKFLSRVATRIVNGVQGINRVVHDHTSKPPGTISGSEGKGRRPRSPAPRCGNQSSTS